MKLYIHIITDKGTVTVLNVKRLRKLLNKIPFGELFAHINRQTKTIQQGSNYTPFELHLESGDFNEVTGEIKLKQPFSYKQSVFPVVNYHNQIILNIRLKN